MIVLLVLRYCPGFLSAHDFPVSPIHLPNGDVTFLLGFVLCASSSLRGTSAFGLFRARNTGGLLHNTV